MTEQNESRRNLGAWIGLGVFGVLILALAGAMLTTENRPDPMIGQPAPAITAPLLSGNAVEGAQVVNFWATWCTPCLAEHPVLMEMQERGVEIVGVAYNDDPEKIADYLARHGNPFAAIHLDNGEGTVANWGIRGVPETFSVGADGVVQDRVTGQLEAVMIPQ